MLPAGRYIHYLSLLTITIQLLCVLASCNPHHEITPDDEDRVFLLVHDPAAVGQYDKAIAISDSLLQNCTMSDSLRGFIMIERIVAFLNSGRLDEGMAYSDTLISFGRSHRIGAVEMQGEQGRGLIFRRREMFDSAVNCYKRGLRLAIAENDAETEQTFADFLAIVYAETDRTQEAFEFANHSLNLAKQIDDTIAILSAISTIGGIYMKEDRNAEIIDALKPYAMIAETASPPYLIKFLTPMVRAYISLDSVDAARRLIRRMEEVAVVLPPTHQATSMVLSAKANLLELEKRYAEQWRIYMTIDSLGNHGKPRDARLLERAQCQANMGNYRQAYTMMSDAYRSLDSIRHLEIDRTMSELSIRYDTLHKDMEIQRLSRQRWTLVSIILLCIIVLGAGVIAVINSRRRHLRRLEQEKHREYIRGLEQERARMARELHDDVAGDLLGLRYELESKGTSHESKRLQEIADKVRRLSHELMPPQFASESLTALLLDYTRNFNLTHSSPALTITDEGSFDWASLPLRSSYELYRIVQEAVSNALRHSEATYINITLGGDENGSSLSVTNDGVSPDHTSGSGGIGSRTLRARARIIGASADVTIRDSIYILTITQS